MMLVIEVAAVLSGAVFGVLLARRKGMDFVGVYAVALMTAFGGGTLRDLFLDRHPLFWIQNPGYPVAVFAVAIVMSMLPRIPAQTARWLNLPDALGLGLFSVLGTEIALGSGVAPFVAVLFGVMSGTFGGVIGDIVCNEVPSLFRPSTPLYATCAFVGGWVLVGAKLLPLPDGAAVAIAAGITVLMRLVALHFRLTLKAIE